MYNIQRNQSGTEDWPREQYYVLLPSHSDVAKVKTNRFYNRRTDACCTMSVITTLTVDDVVVCLTNYSATAILFRRFL